MVEEKTEKHEHEHQETHDSKKVIIKKDALWGIGAFVLLVLLVISVFTGGFGITGKVVSESVVGDKVINFLNDYVVPGGGITLDSVKEDTSRGLYVVNVNNEGNVVPVYLSKDGQYIDIGSGIMNINAFIKSLSASTENTPAQTQDVPKTDKPNVELYVFTYCPYGLQMEKAMIPVVNLLGDKIDFRIRQIGAMHGEFEKIEAERQLCIEKNYPDKFLNYVLAFAEDTSIGSCSGDATCLTPKLNALYTKLGISASKINSCMTSEGLNLYNAEVSNSQSKGASGSPTLIVNGVNSQVGRSPDAVKTALCAAFNTTPSECSQTLSTSQASAGFGSGSSSSTTAQC